MALSDDELWVLWNAQGTDDMSRAEAFTFARAIEAEARKRDDVLIRQCMEALECAGAYTALIDDFSLSAIQEAYEAASARLESKP